MSAVSAADPSAADPSSSSTPQDAGEAGVVHGGEGGGGENQGGTPAGEDQGGASGERQDSPDVEVVEGSQGRGVPVIKPALVYTKKGEVVEVDQKVLDDVDRFCPPVGFVRKGSREDSSMYSLGVYVEETGGINHKYLCMADPACRRAKKMIPCKNGDRSNVNTHLKRHHEMQGTGGVKKEAQKQKQQGGIEACFDASLNSSVGTHR